MKRLALLALLLGSCGSRSEAAPAHGTSSGSEPRSSSDESATPATSGPADPALRAILDAHTARRADHCAPPLAWSDALAQQSQRWAEHLASSGCQLEHSDTAYGENLAAGTSGTLSPEEVVGMWYREIDQYSFRRGGFSMDTGHFTQLVWVGSTSLGCAMTTCGGMDVWVCNYDPPGNVDGEYEGNVLPTSCQ